MRVSLSLSLLIHLPVRKMAQWILLKHFFPLLGFHQSIANTSLDGVGACDEELK